MWDVRFKKRQKFLTTHLTSHFSHLLLFVTFELSNYLLYRRLAFMH
jgi:hypothetical protein